MFESFEMQFTHFDANLSTVPIVGVKQRMLLCALYLLPMNRTEQIVYLT